MNWHSEWCIYNDLYWQLPNEYAYICKENLCLYHLCVESLCFYIVQWNYLRAVFHSLNFPAKHGCLKMLREQKSSWNYSKGWDKGSITSLLEEPAGQQCGWVRSQLLALLPLGTWESILTLLTFYQPNASVNLNLIRAKQNGETLWHHQLLAEEWVSEKWIWSFYCHLTHSLMCDLVFWWTFPSFILHFCFSFNKKFT